MTAGVENLGVGDITLSRVCIAAKITHDIFVM